MIELYNFLKGVPTPPKVVGFIRLPGYRIRVIIESIKGPILSLDGPKSSPDIGRGILAVLALLYGPAARNIKIIELRSKIFS